MTLHFVAREVGAGRRRRLAGLVLLSLAGLPFPPGADRNALLAAADDEKPGADEKAAETTTEMDRLVLADGKIVEGTLLDIQEKDYVIRTQSGKVQLPRSSVKAVGRFLSDKRVEAWTKNAAEFEGEEKLRKFATYLREKHAFPEERICWRRLLELKPEDGEAHLALGHLQLDGKWLPEPEAENKLKEGFEAVAGKLVKKEGPTIVKAPRDDGAKAVAPEKGKSTGKKGTDAKKADARNIRALDHVAMVLDEKDAHSLWMLLKRSGIFVVREKDFAAAVNIKSCEALIEYVSEKNKDYKTSMGALLKRLGVPRDWDAYNQGLIKEFTSKFPQGIHLETKHYHILSTASKDMTQTLGHHMDIVVDQVYHKIFEFEEKIPYKYILRFWKDDKEFMANGASLGVAAYFKPTTKELVGYNLKSTGMSLQDPYQTLFHEGWHQYFDFYIPDAPRWFDEGFAEVIYPTVIKGNTAIRNGFNALRSSSVRQAAAKGQLIPLRELVKMTVEQAYDPARVHVAYAQSWSFVYFLTSYTNPDRKIQEKVRNFYKDYFWELHKGTDFADAVDIVFKDVKFDTLEQAWIKAIPFQK